MNELIVILGAGESGVGAAVLAQKEGYEVFVSDGGSIKPRYKQMLQEYAIEFEEGQHTIPRILQATELIKSPGIPETAPVVAQAMEGGIPVLSEIEFAGRFDNSFKIGITGSNGKTTTAKLLYHIMKNAGLNVGLAGNVGASYAYQVATEAFDYYVIELSSFQLDGMFSFRANIAILTNITPDHLDRYHNMENYAQSKFRIIQNQTSEDLFVYCADDPVTQEQLKQHTVDAQLYPFSLQKAQVQGAFKQNDEMICKYKSNTLTMAIHDLALRGQHNTYNSMAAGIAAQAIKIRNHTIRESLSSFQGVEHRLEPVVKVHGIEFINDSKATNINSTWYALESMPDNLIWIVGGVDKGNDYSVLQELVRQKVKAIVCLGTDNKKLHDSFEGIVDTIVDTQSASDAVRTAYYLARKGDTVLLSPACASFDLFDNYEDRGMQFKKAVREL
jgi:UDP-N-acetylmuramoylalanine--D-glutamate ligase